MNQKDYIKNLFQKYLNHSISRAELEVLLNYMSQYQSEDEVKAWMDAYWHTMESTASPKELEGHATARLSQIMDKIEHQIPNRVPTKSPKVVMWRSWAIAASLILAFFLSTYWIAESVFQLSEGNESNTFVDMDRYVGQQFLLLPDGSSVIMNEGSELSFAPSFGTADREIYFSGQGFFDITHDPTKPFLIRTGEVTTKVLGTAFAISALPDSDEVEVTVARGKVAVGDQKESYDELLPEEQMIVDTKRKEFHKKTIDIESELAWKEKFLIFHEASISEVISKLKQKFQVDILIENQEMLACKFNANFMKGESIEQIIRVICGVFQAEYIQKEQQIKIIGGRKCNE